jgi:acyl-CoA synthetase (AMP-forming)/AMP-acid ligase II
MNERVNFSYEPNDGELKAALRSAVRPTGNDVDWERLHERIMDAAAACRPASPARASDWIAAWSRRSIPAVASVLAAAVATLLFLPIERQTRDAQPPGFWPVAEELMSDLPEETRRMLLAGEDMESLLRAVMADGRAERNNS